MSEALKTGWPPGLLQDDDRGLSRWFASRPDARREAREAAYRLTAPARGNDDATGQINLTSPATPTGDGA